MFITVRPISLSKLPKLKHNQLVKNVIEVLEQFDLKALRLQTGMEMLLELRPQLLKLEDDYGSHPLSEDISAAKERRLELAGFVSSHMQLLMRIDMKDQRKAVSIAKYSVRSCLLGIRKNDQTMITGKLNQFFHIVDKDPKVQDAFRQLGFQDYLDELRLMNTTYNDLFYERISSISKRPTRESKPIQKYCQAVLRNLFEHIELSQRTYRDQDYSLLIDSLNTVLAKYTRNIKLRVTYNKKRAEAKAASKIAAKMNPKVHILSVNGKETGSVTIGGSKEVKKKLEKRTTNKQKNKLNTKKVLQQKKDKSVGLLKILELPPRNRN